MLSPSYCNKPFFLIQHIEEHSVEFQFANKPFKVSSIWSTCGRSSKKKDTKKERREPR